MILTILPDLDFDFAILVFLLEMSVLHPIFKTLENLGSVCIDAENISMQLVLIPNARQDVIGINSDSLSLFLPVRVPFSLEDGTVLVFSPSTEHFYSARELEVVRLLLEAEFSLVKAFLHCVEERIAILIELVRDLFL